MFIECGRMRIMISSLLAVSLATPADAGLFQSAARWTTARLFGARPAAAAPEIAPAALTAAPGIAPAPSPAAELPSIRPGVEAAAFSESAAERREPLKPQDVSAAFDGAAPGGWTEQTVPSPVDGTPLSVMRRGEDRAQAARVYSGGLALAESFDSYFESRPKDERPTFFLRTRAHPPTPWLFTRTVIDADARDLAAVITKAASASASGKVELVLHSFGTLVFQRLLQLGHLPEVREALGSLTGSRVVLLNATTHYPGSEKQAGPDFERMAKATVSFVEWLDMVDAWSGWIDSLGRLGWWFARQMAPWSKVWPTPKAYGAWPLQRPYFIAAASQQAISMMRADLKGPWTADVEPIRARLAAQLESHAADAGWQEALLRRSADMFRLNFMPSDVERLRALNLELELVHSTRDALLNWKSAQILFERLGLNAPEKLPEAGTVIAAQEGRWRAHIVEGDHYFPLKRPAWLAKILDR